MTENINLIKKDRESSASLLKRFTQKVRTSGIIPRVKGIRYFERDASALVRKQGALKKISRRATQDRLKKLGKI